jgi:hypothetical protein
MYGSHDCYNSEQLVRQVLTSLVETVYCFGSLTDFTARQLWGSMRNPNDNPWLLQQ